MSSKSFTSADRAMGRVQRNQMNETEELVRVIDKDNNRLKYSGYNFSERLHIIESGISNYRKRIEASRENGERMFQTEEEAREK